MSISNNTGRESALSPWGLTARSSGSTGDLVTLEGSTSTNLATQTPLRRERSPENGSRASVAGNSSPVSGLELTRSSNSSPLTVVANALGNSFFITTPESLSERSVGPVFPNTVSSGSSRPQALRDSNLFSEKVWRVGSEAVHYNSNGDVERIGSKKIIRDPSDDHVIRVGNDEVFYDEKGRATHFGEKELTYTNGVLTHIGKHPVVLEKDV